MPCVFVVTGPSGVGKTTLAECACRQLSHCLVRATTYTTREPRPGEVDGVDYHFVSQATFEGYRRRGLFLEWSNAYKAWYATAYHAITHHMSAGLSVILVLDRDGVQSVKAAYPQYTYVLYVMPPSFQELVRRFHARSSGDTEFRLQRARQELAREEEAPVGDVYVVNDDKERACDDVVGFIRQKVMQRENF